MGQVSSILVSFGQKIPNSDFFSLLFLAAPEVVAALAEVGVLEEVVVVEAVTEEEEEVTEAVEVATEEEEAAMAVVEVDMAAVVVVGSVEAVLALVVGIAWENSEMVSRTSNGRTST